MTMTTFYFVTVLVIAHVLPFISTGDVYNIDATQSGGRRFDGIGGLSGGGATSKLLVNYPDEQRNQILDYLFKPNFGASLHILKVEIGGDAQSTDGTEASHMHYAWDENYHRGYEWWLMKEAKKRNPDILLYCLPWAFPAWVGNGTRNPYHSPDLTASYVVKYILGAQKYHNLTMNYVGIWNERPYDSKYIKILRKTLDSSGLKGVKIVAADGLWEPITFDIILDKELAAAVDIIGVHYPGTKSSQGAVDSKKALWSSEDYSTFNDNVGAGCWARILNQNYVNGYMTSTISWNLIASYYEALPYTRNGLMTADKPWSGHYTVESPIWITAHTTQFVWPGWYYLPHDNGVSLLKHGGSMVSFVSFDGTQLTVVIETMSRNHSVCVRPHLPEYNVEPQNITLVFKGLFAQIIQEMNVRYSKLGFNGADTVLFKDKGTIPVNNATLELSLGVDEVYTLSTLQTGNKGYYGNVPPVKPFPLPYTDDFESYALFAEPYNLAQQIGAYEVVMTLTKGHGNKVIRQMVLDWPCAWCQAENAQSSMNVIGNHSWTDIYVESDVFIGTVNATDGVFVGARLENGGCDTYKSEGIFFFAFPGKGIALTGDLARTKSILTKNMTIHTNTWYKMGLLVKDGSIIGTINGQQVFKIPETKSVSKNGFVGLGTSSYGLADFDNLKIMSSSDGQRQIKGGNNLKSKGLYKNKGDNLNFKMTKENGEVKNKSLGSIRDGKRKHVYKNQIALQEDNFEKDINTLYFEKKKSKT